MYTFAQSFCFLNDIAFRIYLSLLLHLLFAYLVTARENNTSILNFTLR